MQHIEPKLLNKSLAPQHSNKLQGIELGVSQALLAETASELQTLIKINMENKAYCLGIG